MFKIDDFDIKLDTDIIGRNFTYAEEVESTNLSIIKEKSIENGAVLLAEKQTNGRGRKNRKWYSYPGQNLTFSILLNEDLPKINLLNFISSLAVAITLENLYQLKVTLKWPNDVLINNKKIAGILIDTSSKGSSIEKAAVGIGLNVNQNIFQGTYMYQPTSIRKELADEVSREKTLAELLNVFEEQYSRAIEDPNSVLTDWKSRCRMLGEKVILENDDVTKVGVFEDLDEDGFLILKTGNSFERITVGDLSPVA